ncbi:MAG: hypothetical protein U1D30_02815 [Planctomycetota bacterium]
MPSFGQPKTASRPRMDIATRDVNLNRNRHSKLPNKPVDPMLAVIRVGNWKAIAIMINLPPTPP